MRRLSLIAAATLAALAASPGAADPAATIPGAVRQSSPAIYRFTVGEAQVTALSDGTGPMDAHKMLQGISPGEEDALLARSFLANPVQGSVNAFLIEMGGRVILVDTGMGLMFGPGNGGRLGEALQEAGVRPEQVNDILLTHAHPDHIGGMTLDGRAVFPNAVVHVGKPELDVFLDPSKSHSPPLTGVVRAMFKPYLDAGRVRPFDRNGEILPGVMAELRPGHSPGSAFYRLTSGGQELVIVGDIVHVAAVQLPRPDVTFRLDYDPAMARADREAALREFAEKTTLVAAPHISFPGVGHIVADPSGGYRWIPVDYGDHDPKAAPSKF